MRRAVRCARCGVRCVAAVVAVLPAVAAPVAVVAATVVAPAVRVCVGSVCGVVGPCMVCCCSSGRLCVWYGAQAPVCVVRSTRTVCV